MSVHTTSHPTLTGDPRQVGVPNWCTECSDRVCLECRKSDHESGGGSWMSGHCFNCQWIVSERIDARRRQYAVDRENEMRATAWDEGYKAALAQDGHNPYR